MSHSFSTYHPISEQGTRHAHPRASAAAMSRHVQRSHKGYTLTHAGHQIRIGPVAFWIVVGALVVMGVWSIATGTYFAFRENVLTRLIGRQAEMQFAYEDRIAELRAQVDRVMGRQLLDQEQFEQKLNTLLQRQATLEQRTKALGGETLTTGTVKPSRVAPPGAAERTPRASPINDTVIFVVPPDREARLYSREFSAAATQIAERTTSGGLTGVLSRMSLSLDKVEQTQSASLTNLEELIDTRARRMRSVLADLGVDPVRSRGEGPVGGPFVPIKPPQAGASAFERQLYRVNVARAQIDRYTHTFVAVPVRKPIIGEVDMSSPFGMRMDPFLRPARCPYRHRPARRYGRAGPRNGHRPRDHRRARGWLRQHGRDQSRQRSREPLRAPVADRRQGRSIRPHRRDHRQDRLDGTLDRPSSSL